MFCEANNVLKLNEKYMKQWNFNKKKEILKWKTEQKGIVKKLYRKWIKQLRKLGLQFFNDNQS